MESPIHGLWWNKENGNRENGLNFISPTKDGGFDKWALEG